MTIIKRILVLIFSILLFLLLWSIYTPRRDGWRSASDWGNATPAVRAGVIHQLEQFQDGYIRRDTSQLDAYMDRVFSRDRPIVLGTMPGEIYVGYTDITRLVKEDWESWGDCRFRLDQTEVSSSGDVAWFATVGRVKFDLSRFLILPLRLTGVMVNESGTWKVRQAQFQFDLDLSWLILSQLLLAIWSAVNVILLGISIYRHVRIQQDRTAVAKGSSR